MLVKKDKLAAVLNDHSGYRLETQPMESVEMIEEKVSLKEAQVVRKAEEGTRDDHRASDKFVMGNNDHSFKSTLPEIPNWAGSNSDDLRSSKSGRGEART